ncbi:MAG TPA: hypothetical protein VLI04_19330, partial [Nocardioidaceae bacterium]|nr:hypothetical protein [Nocardioidaceae bacterium]
SAVRIAAGTTTDFNFAGGTGGATSWAVAAQEDQACFGVGSFAVRLATADSSLLSSILGDALGTTLLGYSGLADAKVSLLGLTAALAAASPTGVLDPSQVKLGDLVLASATVLTNTPGADTADIGLLQSIYAQLDFPNTLIDMGELIDVGSGNMSAIDANFDVLDLIYGAAMVSDGEHFVAVPNLGITLPGVTNLQAQLTVIEAPQQACDDGSASTSQIALRVTGNVNTTLLGALGINLATVTGTISVTFNLANATATLASVHCTGITADIVSLNLTHQNLASTTVDFSNLGVKPLLLPSVPLLGLTISTAQPSPSGTHALAVPTYYHPNMFKTPQGTQTVPNVTASQVSLLGIPLGGTIVTPLLNTVLNPIVGAVNTMLTNVVNPVLGLNLAGADLFVVPTATCAKPALRG